MLARALGTVLLSPPPLDSGPRTLGPGPGSCPDRPPAGWTQGWRLCQTVPKPKPHLGATAMRRPPPGSPGCAEQSPAGPLRRSHVSISQQLPEAGSPSQGSHVGCGICWSMSTGEARQVLEQRVLSRLVSEE